MRKKEDHLHERGGKNMKIYARAKELHEKFKVIIWSSVSRSQPRGGFQGGTWAPGRFF